ncbi:MAG: Glu-tRNA(Gln) amidotransferase subunit GatE, partial [Methanosarcinales archaeon]
VDQVHTMRKIVIDGSNTSGFQRTAFVASNGYLDTSLGKVGVDILCLEEEAAQKVIDSGDSVVYSLDRLGIPLVEIGTAPDIVSPSHAREVAEKLGMILRSTGKVKRGLGTIRQDVNISIKDGARVEIKGVQELGLIDTIIEREVERQVNLLEIRKELQNRNAKVQKDIVDVTKVFENTESKVIKSAIKKKGVVYAVLLKEYGGLVGREIQPDRRLGTEFSDRAKKAGVKGIFHTDELPNYGITEEEVKKLKEVIGAKERDCVVICADRQERAHKALLAVLERADEAIRFIPEETRRALQDGNSEYMRPLPGAARMYPETDVPPVEVSEERKERIKIKLPELLTEKKDRYIKQYGLKEELAKLIAYSQNSRFFENIMSKYKSLNATLVIRTLEATPSELKKDGFTIDNLTEEHFLQVFELLNHNKIAKEGIPEVLKILCKNPELTAEKAASKIGLDTIDTKNIEKIIEEVVQSRVDFIKERGVGAVGPLMGVVMKKLRGKADGKLVSAILKERIEKIV